MVFLWRDDVLDKTKTYLFYHAPFLFTKIIGSVCVTEEIKKVIEDYLKNHEWLNLGTVDGEGRAVVHTMGYVSDGATVYFGTNKNTRKAQNIMNNPSVGYAVDEDDIEVMSITGVQVQGKASFVTDMDEMNKAGQMMAEKFPFVKDMPADPDFVMIKVEPLEAYYLDYTKGFGHRDQINY